MSNSNSILFIAERFPPDIGGLARSGDRISQTLQKLGHSVDILVWSRYLQPGELLTPSSPNETVYRVGLYRHWDMTMMQTLNILDWLSSQRSYQIVWGHYLFPAGFLAVYFARLKGLKSIVSVRGNDLDRGMFPPGDFSRLQWTLNQADKITCVSQNLENKVRVISQRTDGIVIYNGVDTNLFSATLSTVEKSSLKQALGINEDELVLGFSGELREKKGQNFIFPALTQVRQEKKACLLIIGEVRNSSDSPLEVYSYQYPDDYKRVIITGHLADQTLIAQYLQLCDIFLLPSLWEGLPNSLLEAMACQCLCLTSDAGGIPEVIEHRKNGFILPRFQLHKLGEAIIELSALSLSEKTVITQAARQTILEKFSLEADQKRLQNVIHLTDNNSNL